ncbi:MAG: hypothetical protein ACLQFT_05685 [Steroidobacteraceae bacterium]
MAERGKVLAQVPEIEESIYAAQQVVRGNVIVKVEWAKQTALVAGALAHHPDVSDHSPDKSNLQQPLVAPEFSTESAGGRH